VFLTWTGDNLLRQVVYERLREDQPAAKVRREVPIGKPDGAVARTVPYTRGPMSGFAWTHRWGKRD
jgi:hypothetical protein